MFIDKVLNKSLFQQDDFILASFPKTGNTYVRFVFANIIAILHLNDQEVNFHNLGQIMPEYGLSNLKEPWNYNSVPRIIKTHETYHTKFSKAAHYIYVIRDPRDTIISYYNYLCSRKSVLYKNSISDFIREKKYGLTALNKHIESWLPHNPVVFRYEDLMTDPFKILKSFFAKAKISIADNILLEAINRSAPEYVKKLEVQQGRPGVNKNFNQGHIFIRNAALNQWKKVFNPEDLTYFKQNASDSFKKLNYNL